MASRDPAEPPDHVAYSLDQALALLVMVDGIAHVPEEAVEEFRPRTG